MARPHIPAALKKKYAEPKMPQGPRLPDFVHETDSDYFRLDKPKPGCYVKCVGVKRDEHYWDFETDMCPRCGTTKRDMMNVDLNSPCQPISWWACDPDGHWLTIPTDRVTEEPDGTISVKGIIENRTPGVPVPWTGTLKGGLWTKA